jgi:hypothetical protein
MHRNVPKAVATAALVIAVAALPWRHARAAEDCSLKQVASIPAHLAPNGALVMDVTVNDTAATRLRLATESDFSYLTEAFARGHDMPVETLHGNYHTNGRNLLDQVTRIRSLQLGTARSTYEGFAIIDGGVDGSDGSAVGGLGADYLANYDVEIDLADGKVNLWSQDHCPGKVVYWANEYFRAPLTFRDDRSRFNRRGAFLRKRPELDVVADGKTLHAMIATAMGNVVLRQAVAEGTYGLAADTPAMTRDGTWRNADGKPFDRYAHSFGSLGLGDVTLHDTPAKIEPIDIAAHDPNTGSNFNELNIDQPDLYLGMRLLQKFRLYIAYREAVLYYTIASPPKQVPAQ